MENLNKFREHMLANGKSKNTTRNYFYTIKRFFEKYSELTQDNVISYSALLVESGKSKETQNKFVGSLKCYMEYMKITGIELKYKVVKYDVAEYITEKQLLKEVIPMMSILFRNHFKVEVLLKFLFYSLIRHDELLNLNRKDIDFEKETITLRKTKGGGQREIDLDDKLVSPLKAYFNTDMEKKNAFNMTTRQLEKITQKINKQRIIEVNFIPHMLRHSGARHLSSMGIPDSVIQSMLGHKNPLTTHRYIQPDRKMVKEIYHKFVNGRTENEK